MPIELNNQQVVYIEAFLASNKLDYLPLQEELLDHICCMIETKMSSGKPFHKATEEVFDLFQKDELKELQDQTIHSLNQKKLTMKKAIFLVFALVLTTVSLLWAVNINTPNKQSPVEKCEVIGTPSVYLSDYSNDFDPPSKKPLNEEAKVTSNFGMRFHPVHKEKKMHLGVDFKAPIGTKVYATADGIIKKIKKHKSGYGNHIFIQHDETYQSLYAHLSVIKVEVGQEVKKGDLIGLVGNTGASLAPHLHYEVIKDGKKVNPAEYFGP